MQPLSDQRESVSKYEEYTIPLTAEQMGHKAIITLPRPMSQTAWDHMVSVLEAMRPALVEPEQADPAVAWSLQYPKTPVTERADR